MDSFEFNKYAAAILASLLVVFGSQIISDIIFEDHAPAKPGYVVEIETDSTASDHAAAPQKMAKADASAPANTDYLSAGDAASGEKVAKKCKLCHSLGKGEKAKIGPNLYGIIDRKIAGVEGFKYSDALKKKGGTWTTAEINCFLKKPGKCIPGTTMSFPGLKKDSDRANIIAYLKTLGK